MGDLDLRWAAGHALEIGLELLPVGVAIVVVAAVLWAADWLLFRRSGASDHQPAIGRQAVMLALSLVGATAVILALPIDHADRRQLLSLLGLLLSGAIALASTSFLGNIMAGIMLRAVGKLRVGDIVQVGDEFGRVTERGLFHVEVQTQDRELTTFPNMFLATNPVRAVRKSGTIVSSTVSLGYDVHHEDVTRLLERAAEKTELEEPFVRILELGDVTVTYRVSGLLKDLGTLLTTRSRLNANVLDALHEGGIEVMSPSVMAQRPLATGARLVPARRGAGPWSREGNGAPALADRVAFDKAEAAALKERLEALQKQLSERLKHLEGESGDDVAAERHRVERALERVTLAIGVEEQTASDD